MRVKRVHILGSNGKPIERESFSDSQALARTHHQVEARYDAALFSEETKRHWQYVDSMSAKAANSRDVRWRLRTRSRYEVSNNSYARGIVNTLANDCIGTGPRIQLNTPQMNVNRSIEKAFMDWCDEVELADKLRTLRMSRAVDGEGFIQFTNNPILESPVQLDLKLIEADQVTTPFLNPIDPLAVDGINYDIHQNPIYYQLLRYHPGDFYQIGYIADIVDARRIIHWFRMDRPGQKRGVPDIMPALPLFAQLRRYTLAVLAAAETAADFSAVLYSEMPADSDQFTNCDPFDLLDIERRMMVTLPSGWKMNQFQATQPTTTYKEFKREILVEIARCLNMPANIALGDSSGYNYSSGRLDHQSYYKAQRVDQNHVELKILDRIFRAWLDEAYLATNLVPEPPDRLGGWPHQWFWDGLGHVDPEKEANSQKIRLDSYTTTLAAEYARDGKDWEIEIRQRARELELMEELHMPLVPPLPGPQPVPGGEEEPEEEGVDDSEASGYYDRRTRRNGRR